MSAPRHGAPPLAADRVRVAAWAGVVVLLASTRVLGFTTDSGAYLDVAANLRAGHGLVQSVVDFWRPAVPDPLGMWPPLYPLAIAALSALGVGLELASRLVSGLSFVAFALGFHALALRAGGRGFAFVAALLALLSPALAVMGASAWSESLYLALATWGIVGAHDLAQAARAGLAPGVPRALAVGLLLGLAADTRYLGLVLVPVVAALLVAGRVRGRALVAWLAGVALAVGPWIAHGLAAFGRPFGPALPARAEPGLLVSRALLAAARWELLPRPLAAVGALAAVVLVGVAIAWARAARRPGAGRWAAWVALAQLAAVGVAAARLDINDPGGRYTVVAWPFLVLVTAAGVAAVLARVGGPPARRAAVALGVSGIALALAGASLGWFLATNPSPPVGAAERAREEAALRRLAGAGTGPVLTDHGHLLRLATGRAAVQVPPPRFRLREFTADDERRWVAAGVTTAIFAAKDHAPLGEWLAARTSGAAGAWAVEDSAGGLVRYRLAPTGR